MRRYAPLLTPILTPSSCLLTGSNHHHRCRPQRPDRGLLSGESGTEAARARASPDRRRRGDHRGDRARVPVPDARACDRPAAAVDRPRHSTGRARRGVRPARPETGRAVAGRPRLAFSADQARTVDAIRALSEKDAASIRSSAAPSRARRLHQRPARDHAAVSRRACTRRVVGSAQDRPAIPCARQTRRVQAAALDADVGCGSGRRVVLDRPAAGGDRRARDLRRRPRSLVRGDGRGAAAQRRDRSRARRQQRAGQRRTRHPVRARWPMRYARPAARFGRTRASRGSWSADGAAAGVVLDDGTELAARAVVSNADPKRTLLRFIDPIELDPGFLTRVRNYRCPGTTAKLNLALSALPTFRGVANPSDLKGRIHIGPDVDYLERAFDASKYGEISPEPYLDITFPTLHDPSLAPSGAHVMSVYMQFAPYALRNGRTWQDAAGDCQPPSCARSRSMLRESSASSCTSR